VSLGGVLSTGRDRYGFVVVHIPHASLELPDDFRRGILLTESKLRREMIRMTDAFCDELYDAPGFDNRLTAVVSRLVCDVERFRDDADEPNARRGQGLMYTKTSTGKKLREYDEKLRERVLLEYYDPHHRRLTEAVDDAVASFGFCLIIDGHSFNSRKIEKIDNLFSFPDFDIGTDDFHTPDKVAGALYSRVAQLGYKPRFNSPYSGAITPAKHYKKDKRVLSVMIETNRRLYMNEKTMQKTENFSKTREACHELMRAAAEASLVHFEDEGNER